MNYLKIIEAAHACEVKQGHINELYKLMWAEFGNIHHVAASRIYLRVKELEIEVLALEIQMCNLIKEQ